MDTRTRSGSEACCHVPEERSAALQDVSRMGANNAAREAIRVQEIFTSYFFEESAVPWQHHRLHYAQPKALLRAIHIAIRAFFHLLSYVNCSYSIPSFSPFDFYFSVKQAQVYKCGSFHLQRIGKRTNHGEYPVIATSPTLKITFGPTEDPGLILKKLYGCTIESILTGCITAWYGNCSASDRKALQRVVCTAQYITGAKLPAIQDLYTRR
ncbi:hypothetical protein J4Q44_G00159870 [Coregonus suidteri]|uniref:Uncharacterized protein n=1 Tax=Coregonus suidteri TaxID=861788 RepID=A0AAN8LQ00_9TELE